MALSILGPRSLVLGAVALLAGCYTSASILDPDGAVDANAVDATPHDAGLDSASLDVGADGGLDAGFDGGTDGGVDAGRPNEPPPGEVVCGARVCASGEECCALTALCVVAGDPTCVPPTGTTDPHACARQSDCAADQTCEALAPDGDRGFGMCGGVVGRCLPRRALTDCPSVARVCGCDGRTYDSECAASQAAVRVANLHGPCGVPSPPNVPGGMVTCTSDAQCGTPLANAHCDVAAGVCALNDPFIPCGIDAECGAGQACCGITGACYDPARPETCAVPPNGTRFPCGNDMDCAQWDGTYWMQPHPASSYCNIVGCGVGGGCVVPPTSCSGTLAAVCGCDGSTYTNDCEAQRARVSVAHAGGC